MMKQTQNILVWLRSLADLDTVKRRLGQTSPELPGITSELEVMRERLPTAILKHYDERRSRGKPAIAPVNGGVCRGCHLSLPSGRVAELLRDDGTLHVCDNCGVILFLDEEKQERSTAPPPAKPRRSQAARKKSDPIPS